MKTLLFSLALVFGITATAQKQDPVTWSAVYKSASEKEGEILITGQIQDGWHTYSQRPTDAGPIPTTVSFTPSKNYELLGKAEEEGAREEHDPAFDAKLFVFHHKAGFRQKIELKNKTPFTIPVMVEYMSCNNMMCLPPKTATIHVQVGK